MLGYEPRGLDGETHLSDRLVHAEDLRPQGPDRNADLAGATPWYEADYRLRTRRGEWRWIHDRGRVVERDGDGRALRMIGMQTDVTARKEAEAALFRERERALVTLASIADAVITTDGRGIVEYLNPVAEHLTGWRWLKPAGSRSRGSSPYSTKRPGSRWRPLPSVASTRIAPMGLTSHLLLVRRDGVEFAIDESAAPLHDRQGEFTGVVMVFRDTTPQRQLTRQLSHQATHDPLTGLMNRREFERRLARVVASARRSRKPPTASATWTSIDSRR